MKKGEHIEGVVTSVAFPNKGKVVCEEGTVTVKNVIPGQTLDVRIDKVRNGNAEGRACSIIKESELVDESILENAAGVYISLCDMKSSLSLKADRLRSF